MKTSEILRKLADLIDQQESGQPQQQTTSGENIPDEVDTFVPPLQAKIELMKKSVGVDNVYDQQADEVKDCGCQEDCDCHAQPDELDIIKRIAGVPAAIQQEMADDEPLEG